LSHGDKLNVIGAIRGSNLIDETFETYPTTNWMERCALLSGILEEISYELRRTSLKYHDLRGPDHAWNETLDVIQLSLTIGITRAESDANGE
jgi:hypothetical protein